MKKHLLFDYGRTIVEHPGDGTAILARRGVTDPETVKKLREIIFSVQDFLNPLDEGCMTRDTYHALLRQRIPAHLLSPALSAADYHIGELAPLPGMEELLLACKAAGHRLYLLSNMDALHASQMCEVPITRHFDGMIFSSEAHARKPSAAFYLAATKKFGIDPKDCLFFDDLPENVTGAAACGIRGMVFRGDPREVAAFIAENE